MKEKNIGDIADSKSIQQKMMKQISFDVISIIGFVISWQYIPQFSVDWARWFIVWSFLLPTILLIKYVGLKRFYIYFIIGLFLQYAFAIFLNLGNIFLVTSIIVFVIFVIIQQGLKFLIIEVIWK